MVKNIDSLGVGSIPLEQAARQLDYLDLHYGAEHYLGHQSLRGGVIDSMLSGQTGSSRIGTEVFIPGVHNPTALEAVSSALSLTQDVDLLVQRTPTTASPAMAHVLMDMPPRLEKLTGTYDARQIAIFGLVLVVHAARVSGTELSIHHNGASGAGQIYEGSADETHAALNQISGRSKNRYINGQKQGFTQALQVISEKTDRSNDMVFVISDFMSGYDRHTSSFDWGNVFKSMSQEMQDRIVAVRITSPAQQHVMPQDGLLSFDGALAASRDSEADMNRKKRASDSLLQDARYFEASTSIGPDRSGHPRNMMTFMLGSQHE